MLSVNTLRYGTETGLPVPHILHAGPLSLIYEAGDLRYIRYGNHEVLRRVYVAVRDHNWGTIPAQITNEHIEADEHSFRISYDVANKQGDIDVVWRGVINGAPDGTIRFSMDGEARSTFLRNRIGFCVLHPASCAGAKARVEHVDGTFDEGEFPQLIAPQHIDDKNQIHPVYPFAEMRALAHEIAPAAWAEVRFEGEIFELEDQRNWIDGSFKTYGTPLRLPHPIEIVAGTPLRQSVTLTLENERAMTDRTEVQPGTNSARSTEHASLAIQTAFLPLPPLGLGVASHGQPLSSQEIGRLHALGPAHLRIDLRLGEPNFAGTLRQATAQAQALNVPLEVAVFLSNNAQSELGRLQAALAETQPAVARWLIFHTSEKTTSARWVELAREYLAGYAPEALFASGTNVYFTDLTRGRPDPSALDLITYSVNPQVHAFDNASLVECAEMIAATIESARAFSGDTPIMISPLTLKPRFNPVATGPERVPGPDELPPQVDVRQMSLFGACWTLAALKYLCESGVASATFYETTGWRGVMETEQGSPQNVFPSLPGSVFPLYHVLADVNGFAGGNVIRSTSSNTLNVEGLVLRRGTAMRLLVANMTNKPQKVRFELPFQSVVVRVLDERSVLVAMQSPEAFRAEHDEAVPLSDKTLEVELLPYALARIDGEVFEFEQAGA